jgi:predicted DNA-binding transcriptional regulator AlpA
MARFPKLAGLAEVASLAGVSRQRAAQLAAHVEFPKPVARLAMGPVWREADVKAFLAVERKPGRKPSNPDVLGRQASSDD